MGCKKIRLLIQKIFIPKVAIKKMRRSKFPPRSAQAPACTERVAFFY
jgi:hypothetical protein